MKILVLNSGSSSQKACLYEIGSTLPDHPPTCLWEGKVEFGGGTAAIAVKNSRGVTQKEQIQISSREQAVRRLLNTLSDGRVRALASVDRKSTRLNSSHSQISYAVFCLKKKKNT